jgi:hypothetical protein
MCLPHEERIPIAITLKAVPFPAIDMIGIFWLPN